MQGVERSISMNSSLWWWCRSLKKARQQRKKN